MKCTTVIDKDREEEILIYLHSYRDIARRIAEIADGECAEIVGYGEGTTVRLASTDIYAVTVEGGKSYAETVKGRLRMKERLYVLEELLGGDFVRINQSCIVRVGAIERFDASVGGSLTVTLKNGYRDYISRRQVRAVKERIGIKK